MSKHILVTSRCDYPDCSEVDRETPEGRTGTVRSVEFLVYVQSRGRKSKPIIIDLCEQHIEELKGLYLYLSKVDQSKDI